MKLLLADDHTLFRDSLVEYIKRAEPDAQVTIAKDFHEAMDKLTQDSRQDLILLDLKMPGMNGLQGFRDIRDKYPHLRVVLISGLAEESDVKEAIEIGAVGYFPKTMSGKVFVQAIQLVLSGEKFVPTNQNHTVIPSHYHDPEIVKKSENENHEKEIQRLRLTPREREVLEHLSTGASNKEIAHELGVQVVTVKLHVRGVCRKLEAKNRTQAAIRAKELGIFVEGG